ncbi:hypothetical protein B0O99DRAFT_680464 [Bisporella sp. PMI_857]|nr:hypothetical protein B0O99DRAFT_680464 [Bisporella sp. PMI_857]
MEHPFSEAELRFVLAEIIKTSQVPLHNLLGLLSDSNAQPQWNHIFLPSGRNLQSCIDAFERLRSHHHANISPPFQSSPGPAKRKTAPDSFDSTAATPPFKRPHSGAESNASTRNIQPKPISAASPQSFPPIVSGSHQAQPKKRGRPSKAEIEARNAQALARGEILPPLKTPTPKHGPGTIAVRMQDDIRGPDMMGQREILPSPQLLPPFQRPGSAAAAPMMATTPNPEQKPSPRIGFEAGSSDQTDISKKKRPRTAPKPIKGQNMGETSFQLASPQVLQYDPVRSPATPARSQTEPSSSVAYQIEPEKSPGVPSPVPYGSQSTAKGPPAADRSDI